MEQVIGLIILLIGWGIVSLIRNSARKQQVLTQKQAQEQSQAPATGRPTSTMDELSKLIEMFSGQDSVSQTYSQQSAEPVPVIDERIETYEEAGGSEVVFQKYSSIDNYTPITTSFEDPDAEANLHTMISITESVENNFPKTRNSLHPVLSDFDLKKAVIYSAILEPKYF